MSGRGCVSKHPQPELQFFSLRQSARLPTLLVDTRALASLSCPKRPSGGPNKRQTAQRPSKNSGHQSDRGAIALNSNVKVQIQLQNRSRPYSTAKPRHALFHPPKLVSNRFFEKEYDVDKPLLPTPKSFANDENKHDCRAFGKPQLPSELRKSDFEVEEQRLLPANEKASFRQRARVLGRQGFQASRKDFSALHVAWGLVQRRSFIRRHHLILFFASR